MPNLNKVREARKQTITPKLREANRIKALNRKMTSESKLKISLARRGKNYLKHHKVLYMPRHPFADKNGRVFEHRFIMEQHLCRYLKPEEVVHHINGDKRDNRIENLILFENDSEHHKHHHFLKKGKPYSPNPTRQKVVGQYDDNWNLLKTFNFATAAARAMKVSTGNLSYAARTKKWRVRGYRWKYI